MKYKSISDVRNGLTATWGGTYLSTTMSKISEFLPTTSGSPISWCTTGNTAILFSSDLFTFGFWVSIVVHQWGRARCKADTRHQHINLAYLPSCWIITSIPRISNTWHLTSLQIPTIIDNHHWSIILVPAKLLTRPTQPTWWWHMRVCAPTSPRASSCRPVPLISPGSHLMTRTVIWSSVAGHTMGSSLTSS